jgi:hypothetical protein
MGLSMMESLELIKVLHGRPQIRGPQAVALVRARVPGVVMDCTESTPERASWKMARPGHEPTEFVATIDEARAAGLLKSPTWSKYPARMLKWWAASTGTQELFGDVLTIAVSVDGTEDFDEVPEREPVVALEQVTPGAIEPDVVTAPAAEIGIAVAEGREAKLADGRIRARSLRTDTGLRCLIEAKTDAEPAWRSIWYSPTVSADEAADVVREAATRVAMHGIEAIESEGELRTGAAPA